MAEFKIERETCMNAITVKSKFAYYCIDPRLLFNSNCRETFRAVRLTT